MDYEFTKKIDLAFSKRAFSYLLLILYLIFV